MTREDINELRRQGPVGIKLLGFKPESYLQPHHHVSHSFLLYPNEDEVVGSARLFSSLVRSMAKQRKAAIVTITMRSNAETRLAALFADKPNMQVMFLPFADDIRELQLASAPECPQESVEACKEVLKRFEAKDFHPAEVENIALQTFFAKMQAFAMGEEQPEEVEDHLNPDEKFFERHQDAFQRWQASLPFDASPPPKRARIKKESQGDDVKSELATVLDASVPFQKMKVADLKALLMAQGAETEGKKADLVERLKKLS